MTLYRDSGHAVRLLVTAPMGDFFRAPSRTLWKRRQAELNAAHGLRVARLMSPPSRLAGLWSSSQALLRWINRNVHSDSALTLHCRGPKAALLALDAADHRPGSRVIYDCRGLVGAEYAYVHGHSSVLQAPAGVSAGALAVEGIERESAARCHAMICVSYAMKHEVMARWQVASEKISVIPCCTDVASAAVAASSREMTRKELGLDDRYVVGYCGSLDAWQMPRQSMAVFRQIAGLRADAHFLAITTSRERMARLADEEGISADRRTILSVPQAGVARLLAAADCGLLLREASIVNRVASPVKFAEYLAVGLPVILTEGIGDYSALVREEGLGLVLPAIEDALSPEINKEQLNCLRHIDREHLRAVAGLKLNWRPELYSAVLIAMGLSTVSEVSCGKSLGC